MKRLARHSAVLTMIAMMLVGIFMMRVPCAGWRIHTVVSGSMEPVLKVGEVVVTRQVDPTNIQKGDIIAFRYPVDGRLVCHRVIGLRGGDMLYFETKGDANEHPDQRFIRYDMVEGRVQFHTSWLAHVADVLQHPARFALLCA